MKKLLLLIVLFVFVGGYTLLAQTIVITGTLTSAVEGEGPIPGVTVQVKGTTIGTTTDATGKYTLTVPQSATTLIFSYIGMKKQEVQIGGRTVINGTMEADILGLDEVVVTSLGISREKKALGYTVQDVTGESIQKTKESNIVNAFQGKLAGVQITNADGGVAAGSRIIIRGVNGLSSSVNNQPLFIVDNVPISNAISTSSDIGAYGGMDYGNAAMDLNTSDIESVSVLKGGAATALYGSGAVNGVILITTKTGKSGGKQGLGVTLEENMMWENPLVIPKFQNLYGQGADGEFEYVDGAYGGVNDGVDESWGPPLDGRLMPQFDSPYDPETGIRTPTPWIAHPDNVKSYFETGLKATTSLSVSGAKAGSDFRLSLSNQKIKGVIPNTDLTKNTISLNGSFSVTPKIIVGGSATYINNKSGNITETGYSGGNPMQSIAQWFGRQVDMKYLKDHMNDIDPITGYPVNWNHSFHDNPYWNMYNNTNSRDRNRMIGNVNLDMKLTNWLSFNGVIGTDWSIEDINQKQAHGTNGDMLGGYYTYSNRRQEINAIGRLQFTKNFGPLSFNGSLGGDYNKYNYQFRSTSIDDLIVPNLYAVSNSKVPATTTLSERHSVLQSVFGTANFGFKNFLFLDFTGRNDWSSTLPLDNNSYFYPSTSLSLILTDALGIKSDVFSFIKLRGSYAEVGGTADAYALLGTYSSAQPFNSQASLGYTATIPPLGLKPQRKKSTEAGIEMKFFKNRFGFDAGFYKENTINQIMNIAISRTTGFSSKTINAGNLQNMGVEITLNASPVQRPNFSWDVFVNWSKNENKVVELYGDMKYLLLYQASWNAQVHARPGEEYGVFWGYAIVRENAKKVYYDEAETQLSHIEYSGRPIVDPDGFYIRSNARTKLGNVYPDWFGGVTNSFTYKNLNLSFLVDFKKGGVVYSITDWFGSYAGVLAKTAAINDKGHNIREAVADGGGIKVEGVYGKVNTDGTISFLDADGNVVSTPVENQSYAWGQDFYHDYWGKNEVSVFDASFIKLREVSLGYSIKNNNLLSKIGVKNMNLSLVGRNLWIILKHTPDIDPETGMGAGNTVGVETNVIPSTRSYGFNIRLDF